MSGFIFWWAPDRELFFNQPRVFVVSFGSSWAQQEKRAQTGMKFLSVTTDPRAAALGEAMTSVEANSSAMFFNPSSMANLNTFGDVSLGRVNWIADIDYVYGSVALRPAGGAAVSLEPEAQAGA